MEEAGIGTAHAGRCHLLSVPGGPDRPHAPRPGRSSPGHPDFQQPPEASQISPPPSSASQTRFLHRPVRRGEIGCADLRAAGVVSPMVASRQEAIRGQTFPKYGASIGDRQWRDVGHDLRANVPKTASRQWSSAVAGRRGAIRKESFRKDRAGNDCPHCVAAPHSQIPFFLSFPRFLPLAPEPPSANARRDDASALKPRPVLVAAPLLFRLHESRCNPRERAARGRPRHRRQGRLQSAEELQALSE